MSIIEIENMTAAQLKERASELAEQVNDDQDLAIRYVQARLDAKLRDEKLAEQGKTIALLQDALESAKMDYGAMAEKNDVLANSIVIQKDVNSVAIDENAKLAEQCSRLKIQAEKYAVAITDIHKTSLDAINAQAIEG